MSLKIYAGAVKTAVKGSGAPATWVHGLGADPDFVSVTPVKVVVGPIAIAVTHDATNVFVTNADAGNDIDVTCVAFVSAQAADQAGLTGTIAVANAAAASGLNANAVITKAGVAAQRCDHRIVPTAFGTLHRHAQSSRTLAASAVDAVSTLAQFQALGGSFALIDYTKPLEIWSDNPAVTLGVPVINAGGEFVSVVITNNDTVNVQQYNLHVQEIHSVIR